MRLYPSVDMASWNIPEVNQGFPCWEDHRTKYSLLGANQQRSGFAPQKAPAFFKFFKRYPSTLKLPLTLRLYCYRSICPNENESWIQENPMENPSFLDPKKEFISISR